MLPNTSLLSASFYHRYYIAKGKPKEFQFLELIDRGRTSDNIKVIKTRAEWERIMGNAGFSIEECIPHLSKTLIQMWDIGLRSIFPFIKEMTESLAAVLSSLMRNLTVTTRRILRAATYLLFVLFATAGLYFKLDYEFTGYAYCV